MDVCVSNIPSVMQHGRAIIDDVRLNDRLHSILQGTFKAQSANAEGFKKLVGCCNQGTGRVEPLKVSADLPMFLNLLLGFKASLPTNGWMAMNVETRFRAEKRNGAYCLIVAWSAPAIAQDMTPDPEKAQSIVAAVRWMQGTLLGTTATTIAVLAIAGLGFLMLSGRADWRKGATIILGCFILFAAPALASSLVEITRIQANSSQSDEPPQAPVAPVSLPATSYDPYAGAAVPSQSEHDLFNAPH